MKSKSTAGILAFLLGGFGAHRFYLGQIGLGFAYLLFFWTFIPTFIAIIDMIVFFTMSEENFNRKFNKAIVAPQEKKVASYRQVSVVGAQKAQLINQHDTSKTILYEGYVAGYKHHQGPKVAHQLLPDTSLSLKRDRDNEYDEYAIEVRYKNTLLGYISKHDNESLAELMDRGVKLNATVTFFDEQAQDWEKLYITVEKAS